MCSRASHAQPRRTWRCADDIYRPRPNGVASSVILTVARRKIADCATMNLEAALPLPVDMRRGGRGTGRATDAARFKPAFRTRLWVVLIFGWGMPASRYDRSRWG